MKLTPLFLAAALALAGAASAGPFDDLSPADRDALRAEIRGYLLDNPEVLMEAIAVLEQRNAAAEANADAAAIAAHAEALYSDGVSHVMGNPQGDVTIVEFLDYQCGFCKRAHPEVMDLLAQDGNIRLIQKEFPILGPVSETASRAALAVLLDQGSEIYEAFTDAMMRFDGQLNPGVIRGLARDAGADVAAMEARMQDADITRIIAENRSLATALQVSGTPTFVLGSELVRGYLPLPQMQERVRSVREAM
ncbi:DsbA family protein [Halovulum dunhuangense]|uniref:DsbA family protein n=1 Tax=Halovulum dunhuangense TaxID=1505036 RepID=A0A849L325_9RHOB|nr:DsbA family protein [Halovulum dunhuangense]NNU80663.1 DsbA family protein [Halovulum dunhuangense]